MTPSGPKTLPAEEQQGLLTLLRARFEENEHRHPTLEWRSVASKLKDRPDKLWSLGEMERTGGEPDVFQMDGGEGSLVFVDMASESPKGRRSLCYDRPALEARRKNKPDGSAVEAAEAMGARLLTEAQYRAVQEVEPLDRKTSSWLLTPPAVRQLGGAIFGDHRFGTVWTYHNGADSYYAARGFRCALEI